MQPQFLPLRCLPLSVALVALSITWMSQVMAQDEEKPAEAAVDAAAPPEFVEFPDANLDKLIREILKRKQIEVEKIKPENLETIFFLHGDNREIKDLTGLEFVPNLAEVRLAGNQIESVDALAGAVNIQSLDLAENNIRDLTPLKALVKMQYLNIEGNRVESLVPLIDMKALASLYADRNQIASLEPLTDFPKLHSLYVANNRLRELTPVATLKWLSNLDVSGNKISDIGPLTGLTELRFTFLMENEIADLAPLIEMAKKDAEGDQLFAPFWRLYVAKNPIDEAKLNEQLAALKEIGVRPDAEYVRKKPEEEPAAETETDAAK